MFKKSIKLYQYDRVVRLITDYFFITESASYVIKNARRDSFS